MTAVDAQPSGRSAESTSPVQPGSGAAPTSGASEVNFAVRPRQLVRTLFIVCVSIEAALFVLDYQVNYGQLTEIDPIRRLFNTTREDGLASWIGVTQTALAALTLWLLYATARRMPGASKWQARGWLILALFVTYMAADDGATIHERMGSTFREVVERRGGEAGVGSTIVDKFPSYPWQVLFVPVFGALGAFMLLFLWRQMNDRLSRIMVLGTMACFAFAVGLDFLEGLGPDDRLNLHTWLSDRLSLSEFTQKRFGRGGYDTLLHFSKSLEEVVEMFGMTLLWLATLRHWMSLADTMRVHFDRPATNSVS